MANIFIEPFDFKTIYLNYFLGGADLFPYFFILIFSFVSAYFNLSNNIYLILLTLGSIMFAVYMGLDWYVLVLFVVGFILFKIFSRVFQ